jgi:hypothetical protein
MTTKDKRRVEMLTRVREFGANHRSLFPDTSSASAAFAVIAAEVPQLEALDLKERLALQSARAARKAAARALLIEWLIRAKNTTRALVKTIPQLAAHVDLPERVDDRMLLTIARQFAAAIAPHAGPFAAHGIATEGLAELVEPFETALNDRGSSRSEQAQARADIAASMARALQAIDTLDLTVPNHLAGNVVTLAAWNRDRRLIRPARKVKAEAAEKTEAAAKTESPAKAA